MRTIKFRAWDRYNKQLLIGSSHLCTWFDGADKGQFEIMQFTGLHDKNGKEIYEGDIFEHSDGIGFIKYDEDLTSFDFEFITDPDSVLGAWELKDYPVIGNIWENPELLNKKV